MYRFRYNINFKGNNQIIVNINNIRHHSTNKLTNLFYSIFGDDMKKIIPYILAILFGAGIGVLVFDRNLPTSVKHKEINEKYLLKLKLKTENRKMKTENNNKNKKKY